MGWLTIRTKWTLAALLVTLGAVLLAKQVSVRMTLGSQSQAADGPTVPLQKKVATPVPLTALPPAPLNSFKAAVFSCFGAYPDFYTLTASDDLQSFLDNLRGQGVDHEQRVVENFRYRLEDGREERVELQFDDNEKNIEMRLYGVSLQGEVIPLPLPPEDAFNPPAMVLQGYLSRGTPVMHQVHRRILYTSGLIAELNEVNNGLREFAVRTPEGSFYCRGGDCVCR